jgi:transglutaminase-like putative cysteine protease
VRITVIHRTEYLYPRAVFLEPHAIRLRPREDESQRLAAFTLDIRPAPAGRWQALDQDGNSVTRIWFDGLTASLTLDVRFEVETLRANPFDFLLAPGDADIPVQYPEALRGPLAPYLGVDHHPDVRAFARDLAGESGWRTLDFLTALNRGMWERTRQVIRPEGAPLTPERTLASGEGSCRDNAVLFCAACRAVGIAARFVSGYEVGAAAANGNGDLHAWAEVYLQGGGWRGYDPSRGIAAADTHVPVAAAANPALAAPVTGSYRGGAASEISYSISMETR